MARLISIAFRAFFSLLTNFKDRKRESAWGVGTAVLLE